MNAQEYIVAVNRGFMFLGFAIGWAMTALAALFLWYLVIEFFWKRIRETRDMVVLMTVIRENKNRFWSKPK